MSSLFTVGVFYVSGTTHVMQDSDLQPILCEEVETAVESLKKSVVVDNIQAELVQAGGETWLMF